MDDPFANPFLQLENEEEDPLSNPFVTSKSAENDPFANPFLIDQSAETLSPPESVVSQNPPVLSSSPLVDPDNPAGTGFGRAVQRGAVTTYAALPTMLATADARALADAQKNRRCNKI